MTNWNQHNCGQGIYSNNLYPFPVPPVRQKILQDSSFQAQFLHPRNVRRRHWFLRFSHHLHLPRRGLPWVPLLPGVGSQLDPPDRLLRFHQFRWHGRRYAGHQPSHQNIPTAPLEECRGICFCRDDCWPGLSLVSICGQGILRAFLGEYPEAFH